MKYPAMTVEMVVTCFHHWADLTFSLSCVLAFRISARESFPNLRRSRDEDMIKEELNRQHLFILTISFCHDSAKSRLPKKPVKMIFRISQWSKQSRAESRVIQVETSSLRLAFTSQVFLTSAANKRGRAEGAWHYSGNKHMGSKACSSNIWMHAKTKFKMTWN